MILVIDVGNSHIVIGLMTAQKVVKSMRCATDKNKTSDEFAFLIHDFLAIHSVDKNLINGAIISSVVPHMRASLSKAIKTITGLESLVVGPGLKTGLNIRIDNPAELGSDLVVDAIAALAEYPAPLIVIDMGTATTFSVIDREQRYQGGMIIPGLAISVEALVSGTSQLRNIDLSAPEQLIGKNTVNCMKSGAIHGQAAMIDGLIQRIEAEMGERCTRVATGGLVSAVMDFCHEELIYDRYLLLKGLALLYEKNIEVNRVGGGD